VFFPIFARREFISKSSNGMAVLIENIPTALVERRQWVLWRTVTRGGKPTKVPYQANGQAAKSNDATTWGEFGTIWDLCQSGGYDGIGYVFSADDPFVGVDLDGCRDPATGAVDAWAQAIIDSMPDAYAEVSPSQTGVKLFLRGTIRGGKHKASVPDEPGHGGKTAAVEVYAAGRYFTATGQALRDIEPGDCQAGLDQVLEQIDHWRPAKAAKPLPNNGNGQHVNGVDRLDVGRWLASRGVTVLGRDTSTDGAARWFIRCPRIEAHTSGDGARDCVVTQEESGKLGGHCFHQSCGMDSWPALRDAIGAPTYEDYHGAREPINEAAVAAIVATADRPEAAEPDDDQREDGPVSFPTECLKCGGLLGEIMEYNLATALYPQPELALAAAIALLGTVTGRKVADAYGTRTNVLVLGLGLSGTGKEQARKVNKELLLRSGGEKLIGSERVGSHAGIVTAVFEQPSILLQLDEMGRLLETCKDPRKAPHLYSCVTVLMQLFSSSGTLWKADAYAESKKVKTIDQPHLCVYGTATPDSFWHSLSTENIGEGLMGRLLVFEGRGYEVKMQRPADRRPPDELLEAMRWWHDLRPGGNLAGEHPTAHRVPHTPEAAERYESHSAAINERRVSEDHLRAAVWSRNGEKANKLALIHACSRSRGLPSEVGIDDTNWGIKLANFLTRRLLLGCRENVAENAIEANAKRVLRIIGTGITSSQLTRKTQWLRSRERNEILTDLIGCGLVVQERKTTRGREVTYFKRCFKLLSSFNEGRGG
jgi:hypothetical protein